MSTVLARTPDIETKLPAVGTTIFTVMSALAAEKNAVNLGQGFPDFDCDPKLLAGRHRRDGAPATTSTRRCPASPRCAKRSPPRSRRCTGTATTRSSEITITAGATQAIITAILAVVRPGDEVIVLEPCYDSYVPNIDLAGGTVVRVPLTPGTFRPDFDKIAAAHHAAHARHHRQHAAQPERHRVDRGRDAPARRTAGAHRRARDQRRGLRAHGLRPARATRARRAFPGLAARSFIVSSFGKTYHVTGWKVGYVAAPAALTAEFRKVHQFNVFTVNTPMQHALASYMADPKPYLELPAFYQRKRDLFAAGLAKTRLKLLPSGGTYFQCVDICDVSDLGESDFCQWLTSEIGVAAIPLSAFYGDGFDQRVVRFCFAKKDETLQTAIDRLARL